LLRAWPTSHAMGLSAWPAADWPWVEIVNSAVGTDGRTVEALTSAGVQGLVVAGTGNGTMRRELLRALQAAQSRGVLVWRASRAGPGPVWPRPDLPIHSAGLRTPVQARIDMMLQLITGVSET